MDYENRGEGECVRDVRGDGTDNYRDVYSKLKREIDGCDGDSSGRRLILAITDGFDYLFHI